MGQERAARVELALEVSSILFFTSGSLAALTLWKRGVHEATPIFISLSVPALAALILALLGILLPGLLAVRKLGFPLNVTMPLAHGSIMLMIVELIRGSFGLQSLPSPLWPTTIWSHVYFLGLAMGAQFLALTIMGMAREKPKPEDQR